MPRRRIGSGYFQAPPESLGGMELNSCSMGDFLGVPPRAPAPRAPGGSTGEGTQLRPSEGEVRDVFMLEYCRISDPPVLLGVMGDIGNRPPVGLPRVPAARGVCCRGLFVYRDTEVYLAGSPGR